MKRILSILLSFVIVVNMIPSVAFAMDKENLNIDNSPMLFNNERDSTGNDELGEEAPPLNPFGDESLPMVIPSELKEFQEIAPLSFAIPPGATYYNIPDYAEFNRVRDILNGSSAPAVAVMRITGNIDYTTSGALTFNHRNLYIVAGPGNYRIFTSTNGFLLSNTNSNIKISGGTEGGSLRIEGDGRHGPGMVVRGTVELSSGVSLSNYQNGGVQIDSGRFILSGGTIQYNRSNRTGDTVLGGGGGVRVNRGVFEMTSGLIQYNTSIHGGGVHVANGGQFTMQGGQISNNFSINSPYLIGSGGGLYTPAGNLDNITIEGNARFLGNVAESGIRINNELARQYENTILPGTISVTDLGLYLTEDGSFEGVTAHAFTNYDIGTDANPTKFWRVTHDVSGGTGKIMARFATTQVEIPNGFFVPEGTEIIFVPEPAALLQDWEVGTRITETNEDGGNVPFRPLDVGTETPLSIIIEEHTHVIGHFSQGFTITKHPNGGIGEPFVQLVPAGPHTLIHVPTHGDSTMKFVGWSTTEDGSGVLYAIGDSIEISADTPLFARWERGVTHLTVSKEVTGDFINKVMDFEFTILFKDSQSNPLLESTSFNYTGEIIPDSGAIPPKAGVLSLDSNGSATFKLKHGQSIRIEEVPLNGSVQIIETRDDNYITAYTIKNDNGEVTGSENDTGVQPMEPGQEFRFINNRNCVPPTDLGSDNSRMMVMLLPLSALPVLALFLPVEHLIRARK